jgi:hypothetical protein
MSHPTGALRASEIQVLSPKALMNAWEELLNLLAVLDLKSLNAAKEFLETRNAPDRFAG